MRWHHEMALDFLFVDIEVAATSLLRRSSVAESPRPGGVVGLEELIVGSSSPSATSELACMYISIF